MNEAPSARYTPQELMVTAAAREIRDGELVFVGMRLPILAYGVARGSHAPSARALFECGLMRDEPAAAFLATMGDPPNVAGALWATRMSNVMALLAQGAVDLGFIGGAEVDRFGNLNTSYIGAPSRPATKLPGSGGGADIAILSRRWVTLMSHERRRLVERVSYVTSPGHGDGPGWRAQAGLPGGGPTAIVTTMAVLRFPAAGGEAFLASVHPGCSVEEVRAETGWDLQVAPDVATTPEPTDRELAEIRRLDPRGFWTGRG
ncbi:MAG: CoA-transferase [Candidatus Nephthysia bennettiae]|uniref:CoA-transferase n=1 Tax=Candidatus Nephthysia bennettiae TaxID=3127016 RepID=A0A934K0A9_9BACT|nr:CoA-transferase [Candidatus Dormibacteraeota bacterium]MBJ7611798.1 CoA-transferase [Candidatus Dormibacteraeota bacterium]PZR98309.1 MAG: CoA-transferase [Candidatus Dormibacteraeota bacterium]